MNGRTNISTGIFIDENTTRSLVRRVINSAKAAVFQRFDPEKGKMLETELYLEWLLELDYLASAIEVCVHFGIITDFYDIITLTCRQHSMPRFQVHESE